jgi:hypothetical protein
MTIAWSSPTSNGGSPITGYILYMNPLDNGDWIEVYNGENQPTIFVT